MESIISSLNAQNSGSPACKLTSAERDAMISDLKNALALYVADEQLARAEAQKISAENKTLPPSKQKKNPAGLLNMAEKFAEQRKKTAALIERLDGKDVWIIDEDDEADGD